MNAIAKTEDVLPFPSLLNAEEANLVYNLEVLGLPLKKAADLAGASIGVANKPHILQAREDLKRALRGVSTITKEDVLFGIREAVDRARLFSDPKSEIAGWKEIGMMLGYYAPQKVDVNMTASVEVLQQSIRAISTDELVKRLGAGDVIDADFYEVKQ